MNVILSRALLTVSLVGFSAGAFGQAVDESALDALELPASNLSMVREPAGSAELRSAMRRIAERPSDPDALADAGNAALILGDANAALNFFTRANAIRPRNGRITAGLATATVRTENPFEALRLFDDAVRLGISERTIAADRALAFDLLGNFSRAQQDYQLARSAAQSDDLIIRQAISLSLAGQQSVADGMLVPLLKKNNGSAWRARAFILAARGDTRESTKVVQGFMDARSAQKMERYLRLMPDLTAAQKAAAIHLGHFPASNLGRDSENVRRVAATIPAPASTKSELRLIPTGPPLGKKPAKERSNETRSRKSERERIAKEEAERSAKKSSVAPVKLARSSEAKLVTDTGRSAVESAKVATIAVAKTTALPPPESARPLVSVITPDIGRAASGNIAPVTSAAGGTPTLSASASAAAATTQSAPAVQPAVQPAIGSASSVAATTTQSVQTAQPAVQPAIRPAAAAPQTASAAIQGPGATGLPVAQTAASTAPVPAPALQSAPTVTATAEAAPLKSGLPFDLAAIVGSIEIPESEQKPSVVAVDLKKLKVATPKPAVAAATKEIKVDPKVAAAKAAAAANPPRFWVQIATGQASALGFDYRKWTKKSAELFKGKEGWTSAWGKTDRLLIGPFADLKASKKWETDFRKAGGDGFAWKSETGVVVTKLKGK